MAQLLVAAGACSGRGVATQVGQDHPALRAVALAAQRGRVDLLDLLYLPLARALHGGWVGGWVGGGGGGPRGGGRVRDSGGHCMQQAAMCRRMWVQLCGPFPWALSLKLA
jgi:hypothetical protein